MLLLCGSMANISHLIKNIIEVTDEGKKLNCLPKQTTQFYIQYKVHTVTEGRLKSKTNC